MATVEERLSRLEGGYEHMATKADVSDVKASIAELRAELATANADLRTELTAANADLRTELTASIAELRTAIKILLWGVGVLAVLVAGVLAAVVRQMLM